LISHNHYDQLDIPTLQRLEQQFHPVFIAGLGNDTLLKKRLGPNARIVTLDWWQSHSINKDVNILFVPANHWSKRSLFDTNKTLWGGFVIQNKAGNLYFSGDTGFGDGTIFSKIAQYGPFRLALLPIGAYEPRWFMQYSHVNPAESVEIFKILKPRYAMAIHFGTFRLGNEGIDEPVMALDQALSNARVTPQQFRVLQVGQEWQVPLLEKNNE
jgi:L-ascorbate metabolism protein UlaG (beta-lactamase superfamily)